MGISLFLTLIFMHIAFGFALAFFVMYYAFKTEHNRLKTFGFVVSYLLIVLATLSLILGSVFAVKRPHFPHCPYVKHEKIRQHHEDMMKQRAPVMQEDDDEDEDSDNAVEKGRRPRP